MKASGFTLMEVLMVLLVIGILSAVALPQFLDFSTDAKTAKTLEKLNELKKAIVGDPTITSNGTYNNAGFENQVGSLPTSLNDLVSQGGYPSYNPFTHRGWRGPYVNTSDPNWNKDAWGTDIVYSSGARTLKSCGKNLTCGNPDDITIGF